ncbi:CLUMA_CG004357, isoform A [Clunio marinus]|uniref:CLUMA_CG004357, isoform A n=1 Tax=Clunio marinus TaxID=568069 RepID=A0A1J1HRF5_9DIPT|nr:CLUMA_CG004357, isoform A [Clunio marinus]
MFSGNTCQNSTYCVEKGCLFSSRMCVDSVPCALMLAIVFNMKLEKASEPSRKSCGKSCTRNIY